MLPGEAYASYLKRVPLADGLMAEVIRAHVIEMLPMAALVVLVKATGFHRAGVVCLEDFNTKRENTKKCIATYEHVAKALGFPEHDSNIELLSQARFRSEKPLATAKTVTKILAKRCGDPQDKLAEFMKKHKTNTGSERDEIANELRRVDKERLGGLLAHIEAEIGCSSQMR